MAFYAEIYGYIAKKDPSNIPVETIEEASKLSALFKPCFSLPHTSKTANLISFATSVKLDVNEEYEWLSGFEAVLSKIDFSHAVVNIVHESTNEILMYSYIKDRNIQKFISKLSEEFIGEKVIHI